MGSRYVRRPWVGNLIETGRHGVASVTAVHANGLVLKVTDQLGRLQTVERAATGWWRRAATNACIAGGDVRPEMEN